MSDIATNLKRLMLLENISPADLSRSLGVDRSVLHKILSGATKNPSIESIKNIIQHYGFDEVVLGTNSKAHKNKIPILSWSDIVTLDCSSQKKFVSVGTHVSTNAFAILLEYTLDSRFQEGSLLIVEPGKEVQHLDYVVTGETYTDFSTLKRFILDGSTAYLKSIDPSLPSVRYDQNKFKILGVVVQLIYDFKSNINA